MAASEQLGSWRSFKQHYSSGAGICMPFGQSTWHCYVHVNMFSHAVRFSQQYHCCNTQLFTLYRNYYPFNALTVQVIVYSNIYQRVSSCKLQMKKHKHKTYRSYRHCGLSCQWHTSPYSCFHVRRFSFISFRTKVPIRMQKPIKPEKKNI